VLPLRPARRLLPSLAACLIGAVLAGPFAAAGGAPARPTAATIGARAFADPSLSASGRLSCASCHSPAHAHAAPPGSGVVPPGGAAGDTPGFRAAPSLRYLNVGLPFAFDAEGTPRGGFNRDGRAQTLLEQAARPLLAPHEMANASPAAVVEKLRQAPYADDFRRVYGADALDDVDGAFYRLLFSIEQYETGAREFRPFDAKYDLFLRGQLRLSAQELRGLAWFVRPDKGNCAACHPATRGADGSPPLFTDFSYDNLGVPRNAAIPATADPAYFDLGLCGPDRSDLALRRELCGAFKVPTLRNVATRSVFFHNGRYTTLRDALRFYVRRDTNPEEFYPRDADGTLRKFDDLPPDLIANVNTTEAPYDRRPGQAPALSDAEIDDVLAFLATLTDGYDPVTGRADPARSLGHD